ncbi:TPA: hypothetical protein DE059_04095 [Candidatus Peribacteria bacterium]|jgi:hypothetical protein|nr:hypothetical protein [Candidatus Peribacteria bacterium]|tara:strand:+ start:3572 stop:4528 length:957 start_codon:yes stop_codon:yes gene_type:complete
MKRLLLIALAPVFLTACEQVERLPADEVLKRSAVASNDLLSASFDLKGTYAFEEADRFSVNGNLEMEGVFQRKGEDVAGLIKTNARFPKEEKVISADIEAEIISITGSDPFVYLNKLSVGPNFPLFSPDIVERLEEQWWRIPADNAPRPEQSISPDPQLLRIQSQVVDVVSDHGFSSVNRRLAYHYEVIIDPEKLKAYLETLSSELENGMDPEAIETLISGMEARGEIWIDAETFYLNRIRWTIAPFNLSESLNLALSFTITLSNINSAPDIKIPEGAKPFSLENLLMTEGQEDDLSTLPLSIEDAIIRKIVDGDTSP